MTATLEAPATNRRSLTVLTHSSEATFKTCPRKFYYRYRLGLVRKHDSNALRLGSAYHAGLEDLKNGKTLDDAIGTIREKYATSDVPPWHTYESWRTEEETVIALVRGYAWRYAGDVIVKHVAVEQKFDLAVLHPRTARPHEFFRNQGKIDGIIELIDGRLAVLEHKTTGDGIESDSDYWAKLEIDSQISRYYLAARAMAYDVQTVIYDVVRKPQIKPKAVTKADRATSNSTGYYFSLPLTEGCPERETPTMFGARLLADIQERPDHYYARKEIPRLEADLDEFICEQWQIAQQIASSDRYGRWYRNTAACTSPYKCEYLAVCKGYAGNPNEQIPDGFKVTDVLHPELSTDSEQQQ